MSFRRPRRPVSLIRLVVISAPLLLTGCAMAPFYVEGSDAAQEADVGVADGVGARVLEDLIDDADAGIAVAREDVVGARLFEPGRTGNVDQVAGDRLQLCAVDLRNQPRFQFARIDRHEEPLHVKACDFVQHSVDACETQRAVM